VIVFDLICAKEHRFEGWFASGDEFAAQNGRGLISCPVCGGAHIDKLPAAKIRKSGQLAVPVVPENSQPAAQAQAPVEIGRVIDYVLTHTENVGGKFAEEARKIHYQEAVQRGIRGTVTKAEAESLHDEGIPVFSLPIPPQDQWN